MVLNRRSFLVAGAVAPLIMATGCSANAATVLNDVEDRKSVV